MVAKQIAIASEGEEPAGVLGFLPGVERIRAPSLGSYGSGLESHKALLLIPWQVAGFLSETWRENLSHSSFDGDRELLHGMRGDHIAEAATDHP